MEYPSDPLKQSDYFKWLLEKNGIKDSSPSIAQAGFFIGQWSIDDFCENYGVPPDEKRKMYAGMVKEYKKIKRRKLNKDFDQHIKQIGVDV